MNVSSTSYATAFMPPQRPSAQSMLQKGDTDGSGSLNLAEFKELGKSLPGGGKSLPSGAPDPSKMFTKMDTDGNGELSAAELSEGQEAPGEVQGSGGAAIQSLSSASSTDNTGLGVKTLLSLLQSRWSQEKGDDSADSSADEKKALSALSEYLKVSGGEHDTSNLSVSA